MTVDQMIEELQLLQKKGLGNTRVVIERYNQGPQDVTCATAMSGFYELQLSDARRSQSLMQYVFEPENDALDTITLVFIQD